MSYVAPWQSGWVINLSELSIWVSYQNLGELSIWMRYQCGWVINLGELSTCLLSLCLPQNSVFAIFLRQRFTEWTPGSSERISRLLSQDNISSYIRWSVLNGIMEIVNFSCLPRNFFCVNLTNRKLWLFPRKNSEIKT